MLIRLVPRSLQSEAWMRITMRINANICMYWHKKLALRFALHYE